MGGKSTKPDAAEQGLVKDGSAPAETVAAMQPDDSTDPAMATPVQQVLAAFQSLSSVGDSDGTPASSSVANSSSAPGTQQDEAGRSIVGSRDIVIELAPEHLGTVSIRMRVAGDKVEVHIEVANPQTLDVLNKDRHMLSAAIEAAGGTPDSLSMIAAQQPGGDPAGSRAPGGLEARFDRQSGLNSMASSGGGGGQRGDRSSSPNILNNTRDDDHDPTANPLSRRMGDGLYV